MTDSHTVVEVSRVTVEAAAGRTKLVTVPVDGGPVPMGMHGPVAEHYGVPLDSIEPHATTLDYVVGATAACLTGTLSGMLAKLGQPTVDGALSAEGEGTVVKDGVDPAEVSRAHDRHTRHCPIARTIGGCVEITTELHLHDA